MNRTSSTPIAGSFTTRCFPLEATVIYGQESGSYIEIHETRSRAPALVRGRTLRFPLWMLDALIIALSALRSHAHAALGAESTRPSVSEARKRVTRANGGR